MEEKQCTMDFSIYKREYKTQAGLKSHIHVLPTFKDGSSDAIAQNQVTAIIYMRYKCSFKICSIFMGKIAQY